MSTQTLLKKSKSVPFTLSFVEGIDPKMYDEAIIHSEAVKQSYDPKTQLSNMSIYAGTSMTYDTTNSGFLLGQDDTEQSDT
jgi:hypothetical protein